MSKGHPNIVKNIGNKVEYAENFSYCNDVSCELQLDII